MTCIRLLPYISHALKLNPEGLDTRHVVLRAPIQQAILHYLLEAGLEDFNRWQQPTAHRSHASSISVQVPERQRSPYVSTAPAPGVQSHRAASFVDGQRRSIRLHSLHKESRKSATPHQARQLPHGLCVQRAQTRANWPQRRCARRRGKTSRCGAANTIRAFAAG